MSGQQNRFVERFATARRVGGAVDKYETASGIIELPIHYRGARVAIVLLPADAAKLRALLPVGYQPCRLGRGRAALALQFVTFPEFEYRRLLRKRRRHTLPRQWALAR